MTKLDLEKIERRKTERKELLQSSLESMLPQLERMGAIKVVVFGSLRMIPHTQEVTWTSWWSCHRNARVENAPVLSIPRSTGM